MSAPMLLPLQGELLGREDTVTVVAALHPLKASRDVLCVPAGLSIAEIVALAEKRADYGRVGRSLRIWIGSDPVPEALWSRVRMKPGTLLILRAVPGKGGSTLFRSLALLAVAILTAFVAPYLTPIIGTLGVAVLSAAVTVGAGLLINALFPVNAKQKDAGTVYSIAGNQNLAARYQPVSMVHGRMRVYPRYAASAYTEFVGDDQYLHLQLIWGYGPLDIEDVKIAETPIAAFHDVEIEHFNGYPSDGQPTLYTNTVVQQDLNIEVKNVDGWTVRTTSEDVTRWALDIIAPNGLYATRNSGDPQIHTVSIEVQQSPAYAENWSPAGECSMTAVSTKPIRRTVEAEVPKGTYDIRWRRTTPDFDGFPNITSTTAVSALRSYRPDPPVTFGKPLAKTVLKIRATSQLSGVIDNLNGVVSSRVKAFNGSSWIDNALSRSPADQLIRVLQGPGNARPVPSAKIDWTTIELWWRFCDRNAFAYNRVHDERQPLLEAAQDVCSAGRAAIVFRDGMWSVVWDDPSAPVVQHFTPRNSERFSGKRTYSRLPHGFRIKFRNEARAWRDDELVVYAPGYSAANATLLEEIEIPGLTDHTLVERQGAYHYAQLFYRPEEYSLRVDIENLVCTRGDRVRVTYDLPAWGLISARVAGLSGNRISIDERTNFDGARGYCVRFRRPDGTGYVRLIAPTAGETSDFDLSGTGELPAAGDLCVVGEVGQESVVLRIKMIEPGEELSADLTLVDDAPEIAAADGYGGGTA